MSKNKELEVLSLEDIKPYSKNEKVHTNDNLDLIKLSFDTVGYVTPIVVDEDNVILAGHGRYSVLLELPKKHKVWSNGYKKIEVLRLKGLSKLDKDKFRLFDNQTSRTGHYDNELLVDTVRDILGEDDGFNISALGIEGLVDAFSTEEFTFDLGKVALSEKKEHAKAIVIVAKDPESVMEVLNTNNIEYSIGHEVKR